MLVELHVVDLGIVAEVDLLLGGGLTAITGETGAGKTLLVEALGLLAGERATPDLVRDGAVEARVEGRFVDPEDGDERVLCRVVPRDGRSRAYLDGRLATVSELAAVARRLMDLHGQHAHQTLLDPAVQRSALDRFAGRAALDALERHREARAAWREASERLEAMGGDAHARARELDLLRHQVREIGDAGIEGPNEDAVLEREELLLADAATHREALAAAHAAVEDTAIDAVGAAVGALDDRIPFAALATRLRSAQAELADIGDELRSAAEAVVDDPGRLEAVGQRRRMLHELRRKYGDSLAEVLAYAVQARARLEELEHHDEHAAELESVRQTCGVAVVERAAELTEARVAAAPVLAREIEARLRVLAMPRAGVEIRVEPGDTTDDGADRVEILLAPNPGEPARSLARAASGGELSRAMLAVRVVFERGAPHPHLRRGRRRDRWGGGHLGRQAVGHIGRGPPGAVRDPPRAGRGVRGPSRGGRKAGDRHRR